MSITTRVKRYSIMEKGLIVTEDYATWWVYFLIWVILLFSIYWFVPSINLLIDLAITVPAALILGYGILRIKRVDEWAHKKKFVPYDCINEVTLNGRHIAFFLKEKNYKNGLVEYNINRANINEVIELLKSVFGENFKIVSKQQ